ncbi:MAG: xanthine dehydrogenase family protein subunit M [Acidimicrobiales bacterium]|jgi:CO/xanthine dehydrogenase FAD-binding subunit
MLVFLPVSLEEAFDAFEQRPDAQLLAGGTDFMVEVNFALRRPPAVVCLRKVAELRGWRLEGPEVVLGAGITYTELMAPELSGLLPGLAQASRTVGSPQIRNAGTLGGNLGTASPAGDSLPVLAALDAEIVVASKKGRRSLELDDLIVGPKRTTLGPGEVIVEVRLPAALGSQEFLKVGTRNAMVIAVANVALVVDWAGHSVRCALGSVGPVVIRAREAEQFISSRIDWSGRTAPHEGDLAEFTALVRSAARPIDDHRSTADYRRHAVGVCAERALVRALANHNGGTWERTSWAS